MKMKFTLVLVLTVLVAATQANLKWRNCKYS